MSILKKAFALTLLTAIPITGYSCTNSWTGGLNNGIWNLIANWDGGACIPGAVTPLDSATFATPTGTVTTISIDAIPSISPGLNQLIINNSTAGYNIVGTSPQAIQFNGASSSLQYNAGVQTIGAPVKLNNTTLTITAAGGGTLNVASIVEALASTSSIVVTGVGGMFIGNQIFINGSFTLQSSNVTNQNSTTVSAPGTGTLLEALGGLTVNGGILDTINNGAISNSGGGARTATGAAAINVNGGQCNVINNGSVSTAGIGASLISGDGMTIAGGAVSSNNIGTIASTGAGSTISVTLDLTLLSGTLSTANSGSVSGLTSVGSAIVARNFNILGGTVTSTNIGTISGGGFGSTMDANIDFMMSGGTLTNTNSGMVSGTTSFGSRMTGTNIIINGGTVTNTNSGIVSGLAASGSLMTAATAIFINGGTVTNTNTGSASGGAVGSLISAPILIDISGPGKLINNDTVQTAAVNVLGGTMTGTGFFKDFAGGSTTVVTNGGIIIPGGPAVASPPGTMTIDGTYTQNPAGTLVINLANPALFSQLNVSGTANLGGHLELALSPGASVATGDTYKIVLGNNVHGTFADIIKFNLGSLMPQLQYFPTYVLLSFIGPPPPIPPLPLSKSYVNYLEAQFSSVNHINIRLNRQMGQLRKRFSIAAEEMVPARVEVAHLLADNSPIVLGPQVEEKQEQLREAVSMPIKDQAWNVYFGPTGDVGRVLTNKKATGFKYDSVGALAGFDYAFSRLGIGLLANYDHIDARAAHHWGKFDANEAHASLYATYVRREETQLAFNMILGGGYEWYTIHRNAPTSVAKGSPQGAEFDALAGMEYTFEKNKYQVIPEHLQIVPQVNLQYIYLHVNKYHEHGAGIFDLKYQSQNARSLRSTVGTRMNYRWKWGHVAFTPEINLAWQREYLDKSRHVSAAGLVTNLTIPQSGRNVALAGIDFLVTLFDTYGVEASYDFEWNSLYLDHFFYLGANFRF